MLILRKLQFKIRYKLLATKNKKRSLNLQLFFTIVLYACCLYKIFTANGETPEIFCFQNAIFYCLISVILLTINTFALTFVIRRQRLIEVKTYYPSLFYLLLSLLFSSVLNPLALFAGLLFIFGIFPNLFDLEENNISRKMFRYGLCVGILSLLHFPLIAILFFAHLASITYRRFSFRIFSIPIIGAVLPFLYWYSALYIIGIDFSFPQSMLQTGESLLKFQFFNISETPIVLVSSILLSIISLRLIYFLWTASGKSAVLRRKKYYILLALFLFSMICTFFYSQFYTGITLIVYVIVLSLQIVISTSKKY